MLLAFEVKSSKALNTHKELGVFLDQNNETIIPICFVIMPFGKKPNAQGQIIDFDLVYKKLIQPAVKAAGLQPYRADEEHICGIIHKPMFERLMLSEFAVADLSTANPNVLYELGVRHAIRPWSTVLLFTEGERLPFDVSCLRAIPYSVKKQTGRITNIDTWIEQLTNRLNQAKQARLTNPLIDSPIFNFFGEFHQLKLQPSDTESFRNRVEYSEKIKSQLSDARQSKSKEAVKLVEQSIPDFCNCEVGSLVDLLLSYRDLKCYDDMLSLIGKMPVHVSSINLVREQKAFALNRLKRFSEAERELLNLGAQNGHSSESLGLLGRVYKDRWEECNFNGKTEEAQSWLDKAIRTYIRGFESDSRDAYPGVNALTLLHCRSENEKEFKRLYPVVRFAVDNKIENSDPEYWDFATRLELEVLGSDKDAAATMIGDVLSHSRASWELETTIRNLQFIAKYRNNRSQEIDWINKICEELTEKAKSFTPESI